MKLVEIRDRLTFIPCFAFAVVGDCYLTKVSGFGDRMIMFGRLDGGEHNYVSYKWGDRTMYHAHKYIEDNWDNINSGDVIDVEFIRGETDSPKKSQKYDR